MITSKNLIAWSLAFCCLAFLSVSDVIAQGIALRGVGSVNESMAGAGTAAPLSAAGAIHWNPASLADFDHNQAEMGLGLILPDSRVESTVGLATGASRSEAGVSPLPTMALVMKTKDPRLTLGVGVFAIAGFKLNYEASTTNPILMPQGALGLLPTFGRVNTGAEFFQVAPTVSYALSDSLAIGFAPTLTVAKIEIEPLLIAAPSAAGYPTGSGTRYHFGGGGQVGLYYKPNRCFAAGVTVKSEQYFEDFRFRATDNATGLPVRATTDFEYPLIISAGTSFRPNDFTLIAADVRYFDYENADGFGPQGLNPNGSLAGLGWESVIAVALGIERRVNQCLTVRGGYVWNDNPIRSEDVFFNAGSPLNVQHVASLGFSCRLTDNVTVNTTYLHGFDQASSGPYAGLPGTDVTIRTAAYLVSSGFTISF